MGNSTSDQYQGEKGKEYFSYQNRFASKRADLKARRFIRHIAKTDRILDFGCGGGWLLASLECAERIGVEINEAAHTSCIVNGIKVYKKIGDVHERDFDAVISCHCLEHVPHPIEVLSSLRTLLKTGGKLVLLLPIDDWRAQKKLIKNESDHHLHTWTPRLLANTLMEAGYNVESVRIHTRQWFPKWNLVIGRIPGILYDLLCVLWGSVYRQRELLAVAVKKDHLAKDNP